MTTRRNFEAMRQENNPRRDPWLFECEATRNTLHTWVKLPDGTSECKHCHTRQTVEQTARCFYDFGRAEK